MLLLFIYFDTEFWNILFNIKKPGIQRDLFQTSEICW